MTTLQPLSIGPLHLDVPVVLAPMAGVTNAAFRALCRAHGGGLYVSEMIATRALLEQDRKTLNKAAFGPDESPRSIQLYGVAAEETGRAAKALVEQHGVDHIDLNFGCPAPKVTRHGGGAASPPVSPSHGWGVLPPGCPPAPPPGAPAPGGRHPWGRCAAPDTGPPAA